MFERFTDRARRVVVLAQEEAKMLNHNYIGTEHILLGLIHEGEGVAAKALESLGISLDAVREQVQDIIGQGQQQPTGHIPFTPRAKKVLELSPSAASSSRTRSRVRRSSTSSVATSPRPRATPSSTRSSGARRRWSGSCRSSPAAPRTTPS